MTNTKMTYGKAVEYVLKNFEVPQEVADKLTALEASLAKKNGASRKPTKTQVENESLKADILAFLHEHEDEGFTCDTIRKSVPSLNEASNQKVSALMTQLMGAGAVSKYADKRRTYFKIAG